MYRHPKFIEILLEIRQEMAHEADYDVDLFVEKVRSGSTAPAVAARKRLRYDHTAAPKTDAEPELTRSADGIPK